MSIKGTLRSRKQLIASNLQAKGVPNASVNDGLTTLASRILDINTGDVFKIEADETLVGIGDTVTLTATNIPYQPGKTIKLYKDDVFVANMIDQQNGYYEYTITTDTAGVFSFKAKDDDKYTQQISITVKEETTIKITSITGLRTLESDFIEYLYDGDEFKVTGTLQDNNSNPISNQEVKIFLHDDYICKTVTDNHGEFIATGINPFYPYSSEFNDMPLKAVYNGSEVYFASEDSSTIVYRRLSDVFYYKSLSYLQKLSNVARDNVIHLTHDFEYMDGDVTNGVVISNPVTIYGHDYSIDGKETVRAFFITGNTVLNDLSIINCRQAYNGGAINHTTGTLEINNCNFDNCQAVNSAGTTYYYGGAVYAAGTVTVKRSQFKNTNGIRGGAVYAAGTSLSVEDSIFTDCTATDYAGAIWFNLDAGTISVVNSNFTGCSCRNDGSAGYLCAGSVSIRGCRFVENSITGASRGGTIFVYSPNNKCNVNSCYFEGNTANKGSVISSGSSCTIVDCIILNNSDSIFNSVEGTITANNNWFGNNFTNKNTRLPNIGSRVTLNQWLYVTSMIDDDSINIGEKSKIKFDLNHYATTSTTGDYDARNVAECELDLIVVKGVLNKEKITIKNGISEIITFKATEAGEGMVILTRDHIDYDIINIIIN